MSSEIIDSTIEYIVFQVSHVKRLKKAFEKMFKTLQTEKPTITREKALYLFAVIMRDDVNATLKSIHAPR